MDNIRKADTSAKTDIPFYTKEPLIVFQWFIDNYIPFKAEPYPEDVWCIRGRFDTMSSAKWLELCKWVSEHTTDPFSKEKHLQVQIDQENERISCTINSRKEKHD